MTAACDVKPETKQQRSADTRSEVTINFKYLFSVDGDTGTKVPGYMKFGIPPDEVLDEALCSAKTAELFDPQTDDDRARLGSREIRLRQAEARDICTGAGLTDPCPARSECLIYALEHGLTGVWGGELLTDKDQRNFRKRASLV